MRQVYYVQNEPAPVLEAGNNWGIKECHDLTLPGECLHVKQALHCTNLYRIIYMCPGVLSLKIPQCRWAQVCRGAHSRLNPAKVQLAKHSSTSLCRNPINSQASSLQLWFHPTEKAQTAFHASHSPLIIKIPKLTAILESCFNPDASESTEKKDPHKPGGSRWKSYCTHTLRRQNKSPYPKIQSICAICVNCGIYIFILKKYLHYLLKQLLLKKIWNFPQLFKIKCHTLYCQELLQTLFLKARLCNLHTNFPIKSLS